MAGIYIHIPFCKKRCTYCDFYTEVAPNLIPKLVDSLVKELQIRQNYLKNEPIRTIYFGGGTPSILKFHDFKLIFDTISALFFVEKDAEITFEANPDDLTTDFFESIRSLPFNRISIGIQSFDSDDLKRINRRHTGQQAMDAVRNAQSAGFKNISIDLIYGLPFQTLESWKKQLDIGLTLNIQHISAYGLTYEEGTVLWKQREKGELNVVDDETMTEMHRTLIETVSNRGFEAYEISNFALPNFRSRHNTSYWKQMPYLGIGPSAHSYDLVSRQWNVASITDYIHSINHNMIYFEREELTLYDRYNDFIMTTLRTSDGLNLNDLETLFGKELKQYCLRNSQNYIDSGKITYSDDTLRLSEAGIFISNLIFIDLMRV